MTTLTAVSILVLLGAGRLAQAQGLTVAPTGVVVGWDVQPFSRGNGSVIDVREGYTVADDYAPIEFPGIGRVPSPGGETGEQYDLEEMHIRRDGPTLKVLIVTSSPLVADGRWLLGDLFIEAGGQRLAIVTQPGGRAAAPGEIHPASEDQTVQPLQPGEHGYLGDPRRLPNDFGARATIADVASPWRVDPAVTTLQPLGHATINTARHDYGGDEDGTFLIEVTLDLAAVGLADDRTIAARIAWGRGSDVITASIGGPSLLNLAEDPYELSTIGTTDAGRFAGVTTGAAVGFPGQAGGAVQGGSGGGGGGSSAPLTEAATFVLFSLGAVLIAGRGGRSEAHTRSGDA
jgi:hypothetical protein